MSLCAAWGPQARTCWLFLSQGWGQWGRNTLKRYCMLKKHAEIITWQTQAQQETTNGNIDYVNRPASCRHLLKVCCLWSCPCVSVANYPAWSAFGAGGNCMHGQQVVPKTQCTPTETHFTLTVNAYNFGLVEKTIRLSFAAELAIQKTLFFVHLRLVSACHPQLYCSIASWFPKLRGKVKGLNRQSKKKSGVQRNLH